MKNRKKPIATCIWIDGGFAWVFYKSGVNRFVKNSTKMIKKYPKADVRPWL